MNEGYLTALARSCPCSPASRRHGRDLASFVNKQKRILPYTFVIIFLCLFALSSCDILRRGFFQVKQWTPGEGYHDPQGLSHIMLEFTLTPDKNSVEKSFTLSEDGKTIGGHFSWQDKSLFFIPQSPLVENKEYVISLKTDAQDTKGLSLEQAFEAVFYTRYGGGRPELLDSLPQDGGVIDETRGLVTLFFTRPLMKSSLENIRFNPSIAGVWSLQDNDYTAVFTPSENWINGRDYILTINAEAKDATELEAGRSYTIHFSAGTDYIKPQLLGAYAMVDGSIQMELKSASETEQQNRNWEHSYKLLLVFSEPVDTRTVSTSLNCEPDLGLSYRGESGFAERIEFNFTNSPLYGSSFILTLNPTVRDGAGNTLETGATWHITADGALSMPPLLQGIRFPKEINESLLIFSGNQLLADFPLQEETYAYDTAVYTWIELYFETAPGATIDLISLMDRFDFNATNSALNFSPRLMIDSDFTISDPVAQWADYYRVEARGFLTNYPYRGIISIEAGAGLKDSFGNSTTQAQRILLAK